MLGLAPGWSFEADGFGTPEVEVAELAPLGAAEVVQADSNLVHYRELTTIEP